MKKILLLLTFTFSLVLVQAQQSNEQENLSDPYEKYNEAKINALYLVLGAFDLTYERNLNEESSVGLNVFLPFDDDIVDDLQYYVSPYYRFFFGDKYAAGFFIEGFAMLNSYTNEIFIDFTGDVESENVTDFALGVGLGGKWLTKSGFIGEINAGVGRNLFNAGDIDIVGKFSISIGYRF